MDHDDEVQVRNPWTQPKGMLYYTGKYKTRTWGQFRFLGQPASVVAVLNGQAITECVTIDGAIRVLKQMGHDENGLKSELSLTSSPTYGPMRL